MSDKTLDDWLDDVHLPEGDVTVYGRGDLLAVDERLQLELRQVLAEENAVPEPDRGIDHGSRSAELVAKIDENFQQMKGSAKTFQLRGLPQERIDDLLKEHRNDKGELDQPEYLVHVVSEGSVEPKLTIAAARKLRTKLNAGQWSKITQAMTNLTQGEINLPL
jgi:hypothetical protein